MSQQQVLEYYNELAPKYDENRFGNSYGRYIDRQERKILTRALGELPINRIADLGCGTGRFMDLAHFGSDISPEMIRVAKGKFPEKQFEVADSAQLPFKDHSFSAAFCLHVFMHLPKEKVNSILEEAYRVLEPGAQFIFDVPTTRRRKHFKRKAKNWHGSTSFTLQEIRKICGDKWEILPSKSILLLPIHRFPPALRPWMGSLESALKVLLPVELASYMVITLKKKAV